MNIETASVADIAHIERLVNDAYRGTAKRAGWTNETALMEGLRVDARALKSMIDDSGSTLLVMKEDGQIAACVALRRLSTEEWYLSMLAVDPDHQIGGIGKAIMAGAESFARTRGAKRIRISVINRRESLIAWYERRGYIQTGSAEPFPYDDPSVGKPLRDDLALVVLAKSLIGQ